MRRHNKDTASGGVLGDQLMVFFYAAVTRQ